MSKKPGSSFHCILCAKLIPKKELFSKIEIIMQDIKSHEKDFFVMCAGSIAMGLTMTYCELNIIEMNAVKKIEFIALMGIINSSFFGIMWLGRRRLCEKAKIIALGIVPSFLVIGITSVVSKSLGPFIPSIPPSVVNFMFNPPFFALGLAISSSLGWLVGGNIPALRG
ncbi:MAG: hypothetical protein K1060chlam1_01391 [Candidatus Anoxychlamydiales bacterium]|nr:hypothetical protein [Candidatus Anoxychlamydiales bacterium]